MSSLAIQHQPKIDRARGFIHRMVMNEARDFNESGEALNRVSRDVGVSKWTLDNILRNRRKTIDETLFDKIRDAYLAHCEWKIRSVSHEIRMERALGHDFDADILAEAEALMSKIQTLRSERMK